MNGFTPFSFSFTEGFFFSHQRFDRCLQLFLMEQTKQDRLWKSATCRPIISVITKIRLPNCGSRAVNLSGLGDSSGNTVTESDRPSHSELETLPSSGTNDELGALFKPNRKVTGSASYRRLNEKGRLTGEDTSSERRESASKPLQVDSNTSDDGLYGDLQPESNTPQIEEQEITLETPKLSPVPRDNMDTLTEKVVRLEMELRTKTDAYEVTIDGLKKKITKLEEKVASMERDRQVAKAYIKNAMEII